MQYNFNGYLASRKAQKTGEAEALYVLFTATFQIIRKLWASPMSFWLYITGIARGGKRDKEKPRLLVGGGVLSLLPPPVSWGQGALLDLIRAWPL